MSITITTLYSGGEGVGIGAEAAGLSHLCGIDNDDAIAQVARDNGFNVITADILEADPNSFERPDVLHASPPCPNFSQAKTGAIETEHDLDLARATARFIETLLPKIFTLENVYLYRKSVSWSIIADALHRCGYWFDLAHINAADFAIPQTRKRMWVRAIRGQMVPHLPPAEPWVGWYEAIEDLIPTLPESEFAPWQLERLPKALAETALVTQGIPRRRDGSEYPLTTRKTAEPSFTVTANRNQLGMRAFLMPGSGNTNLNEAKPGKGCRSPDEPAHTVCTLDGGGTLPKAFLVTGQYGTPQDGSERKPQVRDMESPAATVTAINKGDWKAFVVAPNSGPYSYGSNYRPGDEPNFTITPNADGRMRAWLPCGRVVTMTLRALARLQTFPDSYRLPVEQRTLACRIIGNAVPPLLYQKLIRQLVESLV